MLRLTNFKTSNGPDVHVYLVAAPDAKDDATVKNAGFIDLGSMKGNMAEVKQALTRNLCRCGAHASILRAIGAAMDTLQASGGYGEG